MFSLEGETEKREKAADNMIVIAKEWGAGREMTTLAAISVIQKSSGSIPFHFPVVTFDGEKTERTSVAEAKLFIFGSGSDFGQNFGSGSSSSYNHILALKTVLKH